MHNTDITVQFKAVPIGLIDFIIDHVGMVCKTINTVRLLNTRLGYCYYSGPPEDEYEVDMCLHVTGYENNSGISAIKSYVEKRLDLLKSRIEVYEKLLQDKQ